MQGCRAGEFILPLFPAPVCSGKIGILGRAAGEIYSSQFRVYTNPGAVPALGAAPGDAPESHGPCRASLVTFPCVTHSPGPCSSQIGAFPALQGRGFEPSPLLTPSKRNATGLSQLEPGLIHFPEGKSRLILAQRGSAALALLPGIPHHSLRAPTRHHQHPGHPWVKELLWNKCLLCFSREKKKPKFSTARKIKV